MTKLKKIGIEFFPHEKSLIPRILRLRKLDPNFISLFPYKGLKNILHVHNVIKKHNMSPVVMTHPSLFLDDTEVGRIFSRSKIKKIYLSPSFYSKRNNFDESYIHKLETILKIKHHQYYLVGYDELMGDKEIDAMINLIKKFTSNIYAIVTKPVQDTSKYLEWLKQLKNSGVDLPVMTGVIPITKGNCANLEKYYGWRIKEKLFEEVDRDEFASRGKALLKQQIDSILATGNDSFYFHTYKAEPEVIEILEDYKYS